MRLGETDENIGSNFPGGRSTIGELDRDDSEVLFHITMLIKRPNGSAVRGEIEERIYTRFGRAGADKLASHLGERWPGCKITIEEQGEESRQPVCC